MEEAVIGYEDDDDALKKGCGLTLDSKRSRFDRSRKQVHRVCSTKYEYLECPKETLKK